MDEKEILASEASKTEKARQLFDLGKTNREVADLVLGGNAGWAFNIRTAYNKKKLAEQPDKGQPKTTPATQSKQQENKDAAKLSIKNSTPAAGKQQSQAKTTVTVKAATKPTVKGATVKKGTTVRKAATKQKPKKGIRR